MKQHDGDAGDDANDAGDDAGDTLRWIISDCRHLALGSRHHTTVQCSIVSVLYHIIYHIYSLSVAQPAEWVALTEIEIVLCSKLASLHLAFASSSSLSFNPAHLSRTILNSAVAGFSTFSVHCVCVCQCCINSTSILPTLSAPSDAIRIGSTTPRFWLQPLKL